MSILKLKACFLAIIIVFTSCSGDLTQPAGDAEYQVTAVLVKYLDSGVARIDLVLRKNDTLYKMADISLSGIELDTGSTGYFKNFTISQILPGTSYTLNIQDNTNLDISLPITIPGAFSINKPALRHFTGDPVAVEWTISESTGGYILATSPPDSAVTDDGYEAYISGTSETIPADAFLLNINDKILGTHMIYTASYTGAPSFFDSLPFDIPVANNPDENVSLPKISGRSAGIIVAIPDSIIVSAK